MPENQSNGPRRALITALRLLPRDWLSRAAGRFAERAWPQPLQRWEIRAFGRLVGVDFSEVRKPLGEFTSLQEFFTRELAQGARPIDPQPHALVSPCDGTWGESGRIQSGRLFQLKGREYSLSALLRSAEDAAAFEGGTFATLYLSPRDYHRFHMPCPARVRRARYIPGTLWPVNRAGLENVEGVFAENERICAFMGYANTEYCAVAVGATLVGKVRVCFDELSTRSSAGASPSRSSSATARCSTRAER